MTGLARWTPGDLGDLTDQLSPEELWGLDEALVTVLGLR